MKAFYSAYAWGGIVSDIRTISSNLEQGQSVIIPGVGLAKDSLSRF